MMTDYINLLRSLQPHPDELTGKVWLRPELAREIASALNAARQRAEQAERERDEARELLSRIRAITTASLSPLEWMPKTGAEIVADMEGKPAILPTDFDVNAAPTVKADDAPSFSMIIDQLIERATDLWRDAGDEFTGNTRRLDLLHLAVGDLLDIVERLAKGGAS